MLVFNYRRKQIESVPRRARTPGEGRTVSTATAHTKHICYIKLCTFILRLLWAWRAPARKKGGSAVKNDVLQSKETGSDSYSFLLYSTYEGRKSKSMPRRARAPGAGRTTSTATTHTKQISYIKPCSYILRQAIGSEPRIERGNTL